MLVLLVLVLMLVLLVLVLMLVLVVVVVVLLLLLLLLQRPKGNSWNVVPPLNVRNWHVSSESKGLLRERQLMKHV
jgi:hypothetical protein